MAENKALTEEVAHLRQKLEAAEGENNLQKSQILNLSIKLG